MSGWVFVFIWVVLAVGIAVFLNRREERQRARKQKANREAEHARILEDAAQAAARAFDMALHEYNMEDSRIRGCEPKMRISSFADVLEQIGELVWDKHLLPKHAMMIESHPSMFVVTETGQLWTAFLNKVRLENAGGEQMEAEALAREKAAPETAAQRAAYLDRREQ